MAYLVELAAPRVVKVRDYPTPEPDAREVRVATHYSGISAGTELATYRGTNPYLEKLWDPEVELFLPGESTFHYPVSTWGYSEVGVIEALGPETTGFHLGGVVWGMWGHRSHAVLPAETLRGHALPAGLDPMVGSFARVGAVALNAVLASRAYVGETVVVFGLGGIGLLTTQLLVSQGVDVIAIDNMPHRLELAEKFGAKPLPATHGDLALAVREHTEGRGADRVIELTGAYPALHQAIRVAGSGGKVIAASFYQGPGTPPALHEPVIRFYATGRLDPMPLVSHVIPARSAADAYRLLDSPPPDLVQVILSFESSSRAGRAAAWGTPFVCPPRSRTFAGGPHSRGGS